MRCRGTLLIEEDELTLMAMRRDHIDYENDWIIESGCSNHTIDDQSGAMEEELPSEKEVLPGLEQIEEILLLNTGEQTEEILLQNTEEQTEKILPQKTGEQTVHICLSAVPEDSSDTSVGEQEVTQPSEPSENEMTPQQPRHSEIILKPNPEYANQ